MTINCIIIDDEHLAQILLEDYIKKIPNLHLVAKCSGAVEAIDLLQKEAVDLVFLDIHMPQLTGIEFLKIMRNNRPNIIFTTAYAEYALESYQFDVIDYLLKPITFERFVQAIQKANEYISMKKKAAQQQTKPVIHIEEKVEVDKEYMFVKSGYKMVKVRYKDILYIEGLREYVHIHTPKESIVTLDSMKNLEQILPLNQFLRVHKSYIISIEKVDAFTSSHLEINGKTIPIGRSYRTVVGTQLK